MSVWLCPAEQGEVPTQPSWLWGWLGHGEEERGDHTREELFGSHQGVF